MKTAIIWFRQDLRLQDNPALQSALEHAEHIIPVFIDDTKSTSLSQPGSASNVWLHHSLHSLTKDLQNTLGASLIIRKGDPLNCLRTLLEETGAEQLYWNRCYDPASIARDTIIKQQLAQQASIKTFNASLLYEPWEILKADNTPYRVYTAYWNRMRRFGFNHPLSMSVLARQQQGPTPPSLCINDLSLLPSLNWADNMMQHWTVGEDEAHNKLTNFINTHLLHYKEHRNNPHLTGTSSLSPHLHFGEISPRQIVQAIIQYRDSHPRATEACEVFLKEIVWRDFAYYLLYHYPQTVDQPLDTRFENFPWLCDTEAHLEAWQKGLTGIPIVDAGMRQLWHTGWMHNRVRMIVASFLTKNLLIPWQEGEHWFRDTLVDADLASNVFGWQWAAGSGADAAPYFRIFNPVLQSRKFDSEGEYIRCWIPELANMNSKHIHHPEKAFNGYPAPVVDLKASRERALEAFSSIKNGSRH
ncbi:MAG: Deoxyribodipyrimidine photolyase (EC [uncultured Thiotrichaceae bacterium]|uniref:Deoxyribodipyrimidine photo-lyase n=1 Tax=uncultured Thiotrichaceae bacterium TaxID=298394 RepID=A0A6S6TYX1_9GAMM|nr:MAG: Deoxyribodipyrimidine photolyase (EC [uncultured Thiotrichaceae bacterium]